METDAAILLKNAITQAIAEVTDDPELRRCVEEIGGRIITDLNLLIFSARERL